MQEKPKVALVGPSFFSYIEAIRQRMSECGIRAEYFDERHSNSVPVKILYRTGVYKLFSGRKDRHLDEVAAKIIQGGFTDALLVDVEVSDTRFVQKLTAAGVKVHIYMWDSVRNKPGYVRYLHLLHGKSSFDPNDCREHGLQYIPLFAENVFSAKAQRIGFRNKRSIDVSFCGTLHSKRARLLGEFLDFGAPRGLEISLLLYFHSRWLLAIKCLVQWSHVRFFRMTSVRGFSKQRIFEVLANSKYVLDIQHPGQAGLTARTFEALRAGSRLITFNMAAKTLMPPSLAERIVCIERTEDLARVDFEADELQLLSDADDYFLSLDRFTDQILQLMGIQVANRLDTAAGSAVSATVG